MINLGIFKAGDSVFYAANFHNDLGTIEDPTGPEAQQRTPAGVWSALTAPVKQNAKTGHFGNTIDTTGYAVGQYIIRMAGTVATAKTVAAEFCFTVESRKAVDLPTLAEQLAGGVAKETSVIRVLGLVLDNHVEDDIVRDGNGLKTSAIIYCYDSAANAAVHDKVTGIVGKYAVAVTYSAGRMSTITSTRIV